MSFCTYLLILRLLILYLLLFSFLFFFFFNDTATTEIYTLSLHDALPIFDGATVGNQGFGHHRPLGRLDSARSRAAVKLAAPESGMRGLPTGRVMADLHRSGRSEEHTSELQSHSDLVCRLLLEKKKKRTHSGTPTRSRLRGLLQPSSTSLTMATPPTCGSIIPASRGEMPWTQRTVTGTSAMYSR